MNIVIITGGTGSIALQQGLNEALEKQLDGIDIKIIVNAYDNGLSTGAVRRAMQGRILGPSDVRKNQTTRIRLRDPSDHWIPFLECRITADSTHARDICNEKVVHLMRDLRKRGCHVDCSDLLSRSIKLFFETPLARSIEYRDFSLANILYAGLAASSGNSLRAAAAIMATAMGLPDNVLLNDDKSLFLGAVTSSGIRILDEADIVAWGRQSDPITDIFFVDADGRNAEPELCIEAWKALIEADLVILSAGTQWSSLIPTYASRGFKAAIRDSHAKILMVMNRTPDRDSPGQTSADIIDVIVPRYFDYGRVNVLVDKNADPKMRHWTGSAREKVASITEADLSKPTDPPDKHDPTKLVQKIGYACFNEHFASDLFLFDYDDTLRGRASQYPKSSRYNIEGIHRLNSLTKVAVCTGNTIRALDFRHERAGMNGSSASRHTPLMIFADGGANLYSYDMNGTDDADLEPAAVIACISPHTLLPETGPYSATQIINSLKRAGLPDAKIENRGNAVIAIRPVNFDERRAIMSLVRSIIDGSDLETIVSGRSTVEIRRQSLTKAVALQHLSTNLRNEERITYVGDELDSGNDHHIAELAAVQPGIKCLHVNSPAKTAFFIGALINNLQQDGEL